MLKLTSMSIARRLTWLIASAMLGLVLLASVFLWSERALILEERQAAVRQTVEIAQGVLTHFHGLETQGKLPPDEAKRQAIEMLRKLRYSGAEYFWINDMHPNIVLHPIKPELEGKDVSNLKSPTGQLIFVDFVNQVKTGGDGFVSYVWPKPGNTEPVPKISYVKGFEPWGWVIGSGVYVENVDAAVWRRTTGFAGGTLLLLGLLGALGLLISRSIQRQLGGEPSYVSALTQRIAQGDLAMHIDLKPNDSSSMLFHIGAMRDTFATIVREVREGSESVATASAEIAHGNHDLSARTESQASSLEQTAASMEQLNGTVQHNADSAAQASQMAVQASSVAVQGGQVVAEVVDTMRGINEASRRIGDIIGVIDGIAFQTNILALNAAVEAARAGEQGRGFAVVASEVRSLAGRSAAAAKEIKTLIDASVERVASGTALVDQAGSTMTEVVSSISRLVDVMGEISAASRQQSLGVSQVGEAVTQMDQVTQQNAALVEEMAAAASGLKSRASDLVQIVALFKL
ncbi:methyl-accepting chemotaxis protein [Rhodoferax sp. U11-2br]|uniref:methyl-accepting chemotaxis protein n=1 Tax=Rhodoferax sp. U11-2br TaxID=2838878 RepID=UPI002036F743|nr:methyl-accepting chemotaxis protein [Rhodoferax sp. U11-2br]